jgi:hypothetical protein
MLGQIKQVNTKALLGFKKVSVIDPMIRVITQHDFPRLVIIKPVLRIKLVLACHDKCAIRNTMQRVKRFIRYFFMMGLLIKNC